METFSHHIEGAENHCPLTALIEKEGVEDAEQSETIDLADLKGIPKNAVLTILRLILPTGRGNSPAYWRNATARLCVIAHSLRIDGVGEHSLAELASMLGMSRALLSHKSVHLRDFAGLSHHGGRCAAARATYSEVAKQAWVRRKQTNES